jgi:hypothetical protein
VPARQASETTSTSPDQPESDQPGNDFGHSFNYLHTAFLQCPLEMPKSAA